MHLIWFNLFAHEIILHSFAILLIFHYVLHRLVAKKNLGDDLLYFYLDCGNIIGYHHISKGNGKKNYIHQENI